MPPKKKQRELVNDILSTNGATNQAVKEIIQKINQADLLKEPLEVTDWHMRHVYDDIWGTLGHSETFQLANGEEFKWDFLDPNLLIGRLISKHAALRQAYRAAWERKPSSRENPWNLVVGFDEYSPGNNLQINNKRKVMAINFTFLELAESSSGIESWSDESLCRATFFDPPRAITNVGFVVASHWQDIGQSPATDATEAQCSCLRAQRRPQLTSAVILM